MHKMGRPSKLTIEQIRQCEHRHVVGGEPIQRLAAEYGINESSLRRRLRPNLAEQAKGVTTLRALAKKKVVAIAAIEAVDSEIAVLPETRQLIVADLVKQMCTISANLAIAADFGSATAAHLAGLAHRRALRIKDDSTSAKELQHVAALQSVANNAGAPALAIIAANKDMMPRPSAPGDDMANMTDEEFEAECRQYGIEPS